MCEPDEDDVEPMTDEEWALVLARARHTRAWLIIEAGGEARADDA